MKSKHLKSVVVILYLKTLPHVLKSTSLIKAKPIEMALSCLLVQKVAASFYGGIELLSSFYFVAPLINHLSTMYVDTLYSTLKVVTKPKLEKGCLSKQQKLASIKLI